MAKGKAAAAASGPGDAAGGAAGGFDLAGLARSPDLMLGVAVIGVLLVMMLPLPTILVDLFLAISLSSSVLILLVGVYIRKPLDFAVFPTVLLFSTVFRLLLNVATARNVLAHGGDKGGNVSQLIEAFGHVVIGDNFLVGIVMFLIIMAVNFMVITKGAGRIAEVAARFTLDAMPGKQMAIDAELNSGHIKPEQARERRRAVEKEADFYGAMDGASKFIRGEALLAIVVLAVNLVMGFIIGVTQQGMSAAEAARTFTVLSVGDGIAAAIPGLLVSVAGGLIVTRNTSEGELSKELSSQFKVHPKAFYISGGLLILIALIPGFPKLAFFALAATLIAVGRFSERRLAEEAQEKKKGTEAEEKKSAETQEGSIDALMKVDILAVEIGHGLVHLIDPAQDGEVVDRVRSLRKQLAEELGIVVPKIELRDNLQLLPGQYQILLKGNVVGAGNLMVDYFLAMDPGNVELPIDGEQTSDPIFGMPAIWVHKREKDEAAFRGYTVVNCATVIATHITESVKKHAPELINRQEVQYLVERLKDGNPKVVEEVLHPERLALGDVVKVMQNLLREEVSVRDILSIFETLADHCRAQRNPEVLSEYCRQALGRSIVRKYLSEEKELLVVSFDRTIEDKLLGGLATAENGSRYLAVDARTAQEILGKLMQSVKVFPQHGTRPCLIISTQLRAPFWRLASAYMPELGVLAYDEIPPGMRYRNLQLIA